MAPGATVTSNTITPSGYNTATAVSIADGLYSLGCTGSFTAAAGTISPGQSVCVRHTASASPSTTVTTTLTLGGVSGTFSSTTLPAYLLTVGKAGSGSGTVSSNPPGISCGDDCTESYFAGTSVTLTASAGSGSTFAGWSGACAGSGGCTVSMSAAATVTATFNLIPDTTPEAFGFTAQTGVAPGATVTSNTITPSGYTDEQQQQVIGHHQRQHRARKQ